MQKNIFSQSIFLGSSMFGSIVGAGFASGKEVWLYFAQFGWISIPIIILSGILVCLISFSLLEFGKNQQINTVQQINSKLFKKFSIFGEFFYIFSNFILLSAMFAGADSLLNIFDLSTNFRLFSIITALLSILICWLGFNKILKANIFVVPSLIVLIIILLISCLIQPHTLTIPQMQSSAYPLIFCLLFICSNLYFASFIFAKLGQNSSTKTNLLASIISSSFLVICLIFISLVIYLNPTSTTFDMPLLYIANAINTPLGILALIVMGIGILTTAISLTYTISSWLQNYLNSFKFSTIITCIICLILSSVGFSNIVKYAYAFIGIFGILFISLLLNFQIKNNKKYKKNQKKYKINRKI